MDGPNHEARGGFFDIGGTGADQFELVTVNAVLVDCRAGRTDEGHIDVSLGVKALLADGLAIERICQGGIGLILDRGGILEERKPLDLGGIGFALRIRPAVGQEGDLNVRLGCETGGVDRQRIEERAVIVGFGCLNHSRVIDADRDRLIRSICGRDEEFCPRIRNRAVIEPHPVDIVEHDREVLSTVDLEYRLDVFD